MKDLGLALFIPDECWPTPAAVRDVLSKMRDMRKKGVNRAFIAVDLKRWVCTVCLGLAPCFDLLCQVPSRFLPRVLPCPGGG